MANDLIRKNYGSVREMIESADTQTALRNALPSMVKMDQFIRVFLTTVRTNPTLLECSKTSLLACLMGCAQLGLTTEPFLGQAYLVPFKRQGVRHAQLIPGYRGYITLARRSGELANLSAQVVYANDDFKVRWGLEEILEHVPASGDRGDITGAWTVFRYKDEGAEPTFDYMPVADIDKIRNRSKAKDSGPWVTDYEEMAKKTVIRRHMKLAPLSVEDNRLMVAAEAENRYLAGKGQGDLFLPDADAPIDVQGTPVEDSGDGQDRIGPAASNKSEIEFAFNSGFGTIDQGMLDDFLRLSADANDCSVDQVKAQVVESVRAAAAFRKAFDRWAGSQKPEPEKTEKTETQSPEDEFRSEWINLKPQGFGKYVNANLDKLKGAPRELRKEAREKWLRFYPDYPFPLDVADDAGGSEENAGDGKDQSEIAAPGRSDGAENGGDSGPNFKNKPISISRDVWSDLMKCFELHTEHFLKAAKEVTGGKLPETEQGAKQIISKVDRMVDFEAAQE